MTKRFTKAEMRASYREDKAVQDIIVESWLCIDCGMNTNPGCPSGPECRIALALDGKFEAVLSRRNEVYEVKDNIWRQAGMRPWNGCLCVGCLETRIGRQLRPNDFSRHDDKIFAEMPCTERLLNRRGYATVTANTPEGPTEVICAIEDAPLFDGATGTLAEI